ncbi:MAG: peroxiredoxin [Methylophilus sp.]
MLIKILFYVAIMLFAFLGYRHYTSIQPSLSVGDNAPAFKLKDAKDNYHTLSDYQGKYLILYFYPKNDTPGCTKEACNFRDDLSKVEQLNAKIVGISVDTQASHQKFAEKHHLPFTLLADTEGHVANAYHALSNLILIKIAKRHTFLIDPNSKVAKIYRNVDVSNHSEQIIEDLKKLQSNTSGS